MLASTSTKVPVGTKPVAIPAKPYQLSVEEISRILQVDKAVGLKAEEAQKRIAQFGANQLEAYRSKSLLILLFEQFKSPLAWVLGLAAGLAFVFQETLEGIAILIVILLNALIGFFMEWQARNSMEALRKLSQSYSRVFRDGQLIQLETTALVPGDVVFLEAGDVPAADMRVVEAVNLGINESALTGESISVSKHQEPISGETILADQKNMLFRGTTVSRGNAKAIVIYTGAGTQIGKIAKLTRDAEKEATPLEKKLGVLSRKLIWLALGLTVLIFIIGLLQGRDLFLMIEMAIALAIAAVPEGLPVVATIALAKGMLRLAKHQVIVKKLSAVETLGETQVIITDKTGTLTENQLLPDTLGFEFGDVDIHFHDNQAHLENPSDSSLMDTFALSQLQKVATLCNNASLDKKEYENSTGDPLEISLLRLVEGTGSSVSGIRADYPRISEIPFDSESKMMGTLHKNGPQTDCLVCIKGALEVVLRESDFVLTIDGEMPLSDQQRRAWIDKANALAAKGLRVLGFGYSLIAQPKEDFFHKITFIGFVGFLDPPREEIKAAIQAFKTAGVRVIMATGDHPETARNIGFKTDLIDSPEDPIFTGQDLKSLLQLPAAEKKNILKTSIFARVNPEQKLHLVNLYQEEGYVVAMTGDGVNDAPALKKADIGIAMGQRGTEAAKEASDLVLKDDKFASITIAIRQGRGIFTNIRHFVIYLMSCNLSELLIVAGAYLGNLALPLLPLQILFMNMVTDVFPALALGMNKTGAELMDRPPRGKGEPIITPKSWRAIIIYASALTVSTIGVFVWSLKYLKTSDLVANNMAFYTLILAQLWHVFNLAGHRQSFFKNAITRNPYIWLALALSISVVVLAYFLPPIRAALQLQPMSWSLLGWVLLFSWLPVLIIQTLKRLRWA